MGFQSLNSRVRFVHLLCCSLFCFVIFLLKMCSIRPMFMVLVVLCYLLNFVAPVRMKREFINEAVHNYLLKYGYLSNRGEGEGAGALRTEESVRQAIRQMQEFAGLPATGVLDNRTLKLIRTPRCGLPDIMPSSKRRKRYVLQGQKWPYTNLTWSLRTKYLRNLNSYEVRLVLAKALDVWSQHSRLTFTEVDSGMADIVIEFGSYNHKDEYPFDGKGSTLAHAFFPGSGRGGDAHFDEDETWLIRNDEMDQEGTSLFHVAAHEFGHSLGLQHSQVEGALMFPYYQGVVNGSNYELPEDDRLGIQALYGSHYNRQWDRIPAYEPPPTPPPYPTTQRPQITRPPERPRYHTPKQYYPHKPMHPNRKHPKYHDKIPTRHPHWNPENNPWFKPERPTTTTTTTTEVYKERTATRRHTWTHKETSHRKPDTCDTSYDSVAVIRREVFIFKDIYFWRIGDNGLLKGYPAEIQRMWNGLPHNFTHVDAVYERPDSKIVFFIGKFIYVYTGTLLDPGYPKRLATLGLPESLEKIDGATIWGHNGKTFFFSGNKYWRFDEDQGRVELDYPRSMDMWSGVGSNIDAVFQWKDGKTYFFKGKGFWKFNDLHMRVETPEQTLSAPFWMGCAKNLKEKEYVPGNKAPYISENGFSGSNKNFNFSFINLVIILLIKLYPLMT